MGIFILTAALLGLFAATVVAVFAACLAVYDWVIDHVSGLFKALKVLILGQDGKARGGTLVQQGDKIKLYKDPEEREVDGGKLDPKLKAAFDNTNYIDNGEKMIQWQADAETEREIRRRSA